MSNIAKTGGLHTLVGFFHPHEIAEESRLFGFRHLIANVRNITAAAEANSVPTSFVTAEQAAQRAREAMYG